MPETDEQPAEMPEESVVEAVVIDMESEGRKWLRAILPILSMHADDVQVEYDGRVQRAWFEMKIAAFDCTKRILQNVLLEEEEPS